jgi:hypothetical protein
MVLGIHFTRASDVIVPDYLTTSPSVPISSYRDVYGNWCSRIVAPPGRMRLSADGVVRDSGLPDVVAPSAYQHRVEELPADTLIFLLGSRYCETAPVRTTDCCGHAQMASFLIPWDLSAHHAIMRTRSSQPRGHRHGERRRYRHARVGVRWRRHSTGRFVQD